MLWIRLAAITCALLLFIRIEGGQERYTCSSVIDFPESVTINDYLLIAALNNPALEAAYNRWMEGIQKSYASGYLPEPIFSYRAFLQEVETRVGPQEQGFGLEQTIPWPMRLLLERSQAVEASKALYQEFTERRNFLFYKVKEAYYEYSYVRTAIGITRSIRDLLEYLQSVIETRQKVGGGIADSVKIQVEWIIVDDQVQELEDRLPSAVANLNALLNRRVDEPLPLIGKVVVEELDLDEDDLQRQVSERNPQLLALQHRVTEEEKAIRIARTYQWPNFMVGVDYIDTGPARRPDVPGSGKDSVQGWIGLTIPIWRSKYKAQIREATQRKRDVCNTQRDLRNELLRQLEDAVYQFKDANRRVRLYRDTLLPELELLLDTTLRDYQVGSEDLLTLIDVERQLLDIELGLERALTDHAQTLAQLRWLVGADSCWITPCCEAETARSAL